MIPESSPIGEFKSNGMIESAIKSEEGRIRAVKDCLEARYNKKIGITLHFHGW